MAQFNPIKYKHIVKLPKFNCVIITTTKYFKRYIEEYVYAYFMMLESYYGFIEYDFSEYCLTKDEHEDYCSFMYDELKSDYEYSKQRLHELENVNFDEQILDENNIPCDLPKKFLAFSHEQLSQPHQKRTYLENEKRIQNGKERHNEHKQQKAIRKFNNNRRKI